MLENIDDVLSLVSIIAILIGVLYVFLRISSLHLERKMIEKEIEYYESYKDE